jgi:hypothetical protein
LLPISLMRSARTMVLCMRLVQAMPPDKDGRDLLVINSQLKSSLLSLLLKIGKKSMISPRMPQILSQLRKWWLS